MDNMHWAYGITTVPARLSGTLPSTVRSLRHAGFDNPRLFVDGDSSINSYLDLCQPDMITVRNRIKPFGNWLLALWELYIRNPDADRYAIFQDDIITYRNLRQYLEAWYPRKHHGCSNNGYLNLYTSGSNYSISPKGDGWYLSNQYGRGALALVFNNEAVTTLLCSPHVVKKPKDKLKGWRSIDGCVVTALTEAGFKEYVHKPSLVQHTGTTCSFDKYHLSTGDNPNFVPFTWPKEGFAPEFRGECYNALDLLKS